MADNVEVRADLFVHVASKGKPEEYQDRVDWWLEEAEDEYAVSFVRWSAYTVAN
jgi:hypothetical protein